MHKRLCFWESFRSERVNKSLKLLNSPEKYLSPIPSPFLANLSQKKLVSVISELLGLLVNTLTANCGYSRNHRDDLPEPVRMLLCPKQKTFFWIFIRFVSCPLNFQFFEEKSASYLKHLWSYWLRKSCLIKCIKSYVSQKPLAVNVLTRP